MSSSVVKAFIFVGILMAISILIGFALFGVINMIAYPFIQILAKIAIVAFFGIIDIIILAYFFLYWWSDIQWTKCKKWAKRKFSR